MTQAVTPSQLLSTSWLKKAGVPESVVRDIIGHESQLVSLNYTPVDEETKRLAIAKIPALESEAVGIRPIHTHHQVPAWS